MKRLESPPARVGRRDRRLDWHRRSHCTGTRTKGLSRVAGVRRDVDAESLRTDGIESHILDITVESDVVAIADRVARDRCAGPSGR